MKYKKIVLILVLIVCIGVIGVVIFNINKDSIKKNDQSKQTIESKNTNNINQNTINRTSYLNQNEIIRKTTTTANADMNNIISITDNYFIEQTNDLYYNTDDYIGKTIKIEGFLYSYEDNNGDICYAVVRNTPGCCGSDGLAGVDIRYNDNYPKDNTWVEVIGVVSTDIVFGEKIPAILVTSITEKEIGKSFVTN